MSKKPEQSVEPVGGENPYNTAPPPDHPYPEPATSLPSGIPPDADPGPVPGEPKEPRNIMLTLPPESANLLRRISGLTKIPQSRLVEEIEGSKELRAAVLDVLRARWLDWKSRTAQADPFAGLPPKAGAD